MSDIQSTIGGGLSKLQGGLEHGKQKLQTAQEISTLKKAASDAATNRAKIINSLGELVYNLVRKGEIQQETLVAQSERILQYDHDLYQANEALKAHLKKDAKNACECGELIVEENLFCGSCGKKVEAKKSEVLTNTIPCKRCNVDIPEDARFCGCCGTKNA